MKVTTQGEGGKGGGKKKQAGNMPVSEEKAVAGIVKKERYK